MIKEGKWNQNKFPKLKKDLLEKLNIDSELIKQMHQNISQE